MCKLKRAFKFQLMQSGNNVIDLGFFLIELKFNGKAKIHQVRNKSLVSGAGHNYVEMNLQEAYDKVRQWSRYLWGHNDRQYLINEYGLTPEYIKGFLGYTVTNLEFNNEDNRGVRL